MAGRGRKKRTVLFVFELLILLVLLGGLYVYGQINSKLGSMRTQKLDMDKVKMNDLVSSEKLTGFTNIALFGVDSRDESGSYEEATNSDTIIVASINNDTKKVKLCSVYRDTLLVVGQDANGEDSYQKCNAAYARGGVEGAVSMLNTNLDLNITDYVTVNFNALTTVIDLLGGLDIEMSGAEVEHMNNYCQETSKVTGKSYTPIPRPDDDDYVDTYHLNGVQATSYARIRYVGLDFQRTERQRIVIQKIVDKAKKSSLSTLSNIMDEVFPLVQTSLSKEEIFNMGAGMLSYEIGETTGFPFELYSMNHATKGDILVPTTLEYNVSALHRFLFDDKDYQASETVKERSEVIVSITGYGFDPKTGEVTISDAAYANASTPTPDAAATAAASYESAEAEGDYSYTEAAAASDYDDSYDSSYDSSYTGGYEDNSGDYDEGNYSDEDYDSGADYSGGEDYDSSADYSAEEDTGGDGGDAEAYSEDSEE